MTARMIVAAPSTISIVDSPEPGSRAKKSRTTRDRK